jgi:hypothetical protein
LHTSDQDNKKQLAQQQLVVTALHNSDISLQQFHVSIASYIYRLLSSIGFQKPLLKCGESGKQLTEVEILAMSNKIEKMGLTFDSDHCLLPFLLAIVFTRKNCSTCREERRGKVLVVGGTERKIAMVESW